MQKARRISSSRQVSFIAFLFSRFSAACDFSVAAFALPDAYHHKRTNQYRQMFSLLHLRPSLALLGRAVDRSRANLAVRFRFSCRTLCPLLIRRSFSAPLFSIFFHYVRSTISERAKGVEFHWHFRFHMQNSSIKIAAFASIGEMNIEYEIGFVM